jgi:HD domain
VLLALLAPPGTLALLSAVPALDVFLRSAVAHLVMVSAISAYALAVAAAVAAGPCGRPLPGEAGIRLALVLGAALTLVALGAVHWRRWRLGLDSMQLALVVACLLGAGALLSLEVGRPWHLAWWDYHAFLLAGFAAGPDRRGRGADAYTHGHSARVAELSVSIGLRLGLRPAALRALAEGAYLHDVGKVGIPDHVLNKPGPSATRSGPGSRSTRSSAPTSSGGPRRSATPWP